MVPESSHAPVVPPACLLCKAAFADWASLKAHLAGVHGEYRPHSCSQCDFTSPVVGEMALHAEETCHFVRLNKSFDAYKARHVARLISDHVQQAWEGGAGPVGASTTEAQVESVKAAPHPIRDLAPSPGPNSLACARGTKRSVVGTTPSRLMPVVRRVKTNEPARAAVAKRDRADGPAETTAAKIPRAGGSGKVVKGKRGRTNKTKCDYSGCGAEVFTGQTWTHIVTKHVKLTGFNCPVQNCLNRRRGAAKNEIGFKIFSTLRGHVHEKHGGVKALSAEEKERYDAERKRVDEEVQKLRPGCFPKADGEEAKKAGKKTKKAKRALKSRK